MYARVPSHLEAPLLQELRGIRRRYAVKAFPLAVLVVSGLAALIFLVKGHALVELILEIFHLNWSDREIVIGGLLLSVALGVVVAGLYVWQRCRECRCEDCLYCSKCDAVDKYDSGSCPICHAELTERATCFYTTDKDEQNALERWGLQPCKEP